MPNYTDDWKTVKPSESSTISKTRYHPYGHAHPSEVRKMSHARRDGKPRIYRIHSGNALTCHADVHQASFPQPCEACHTTGGWKNDLAVGVDKNFDHSKTKYPYSASTPRWTAGGGQQGGDFKKEFPSSKWPDLSLAPIRTNRAILPSG